MLHSDPRSTLHLRPLFTSNLAATLTVAGAAIGLGNVWRFPYMMGSYGGGAFLLVYLLLTLLIAVPALMAEWSLGRAARGGTVTAFTYAFGRWGRPLGYLLVAGITISGSYYIVIVANIGYSAYFSIAHGFGGERNANFVSGLGNGPLQYAWAIATLGAILFVAWRGVREGIERVSRLIVPFFFLVMLYLVFHTLRLEGAVDLMLNYLKPDFSKLNGESFLAALGQAVFSVGLGGTVMLIYGSYLPENTRLLSAASGAVAADTGAALLASLFIFPTLLVYGVSPESGPTLLFETLPALFGEMPGGRVLGSFFLLALFLVAFLSGLAALEVIIGSISDDIDKLGLNRNQCVGIFGALELVIIALPALRPEVIGTLDMIFGTGMLALGCALSVIGLTWFLQRTTAVTQLRLGTTASGLMYWWLRFVVPLVFIVLLGNYLLSLVR